MLSRRYELLSSTAEQSLAQAEYEPQWACLLISEPHRQDYQCDNSTAHLKISLNFTKNNRVRLSGDTVSAYCDNRTQQKHIVQRVAKFRDSARWSSQNANSYNCLNGPRGLSYFARDQLSCSDCHSRKLYLSTGTEVRHDPPITVTPRTKHERDTVYSSLRHERSHVTTGCPTPRSLT